MNFFIDKITIIIVLYEEEINLILRCLESIRNYKIIIVDNAGNISLKKKIKEKFEIYKYILNKNNCGYAKAANQAIEQCDTEYILMFQADALISNKDISILLKSHKKYENCFITSPTYYDKESKLSYNSGCLPEKNSKKDILNLEGDVCVETILGSIILFNKKDMIELGLFDENFFLYFLDFELCRRIKQKKKSVIQIFDAKVQHEHGKIKVKNVLKRIFIRNYNLTFDELYYFFKIKKHFEIFKKLKKKLPNYIIKSITNLFLLRFDQSVYYFSKVVAFHKFNKFLNKNN
jgi:GT2 family glycosyltransferase|tara:strand:- start:1201 stop:2073 length:873 start_codon:yes stop_codon:yes gene_type:complete